MCAPSLSNYLPSRTEDKRFTVIDIYLFHCFILRGFTLFFAMNHSINAKIKNIFLWLYLIQADNVSPLTLTVRILCNATQIK